MLCQIPSICSFRSLYFTIMMARMISVFVFSYSCSSTLMLALLILIPIEATIPELAESNRANIYTSKYAKECCNMDNHGKSIIKDEDGTLSIIMCPLEQPDSCPHLHECNGESGWTRLGYFNMSASNGICPTEWTQEYNEFLGHHLCVLENEEFFYGCHSIYYHPVNNYSRVCGRVSGYAEISHAFTNYHNDPDHVDIDYAYLDGVSITRGNPRKHIWSYTGGERDYPDAQDCPCNNGSNITSPPFVGDDYYCETGYSYFVASEYEDRLWDGKMCYGMEFSCCVNSQAPWFVKTLGETTNDLIEIRLCGAHDIYEDYETNATIVTHYGVKIDYLEILVK